MTYFFVLGNNTELSRAELDAVNNREGWGFTFQHISESISFGDTSKDFKPTEAINLFGGIIKIGRILESVSTIEDIPSVALEELPQEGKVFFGLSTYAAGGEIKSVQKKEKNIGMSIKKALKEAGLSARYVTSKEDVLSSVVVETNKLLTKGGEVVMCVLKDGVTIGITEAVQPFEKFGERDYGRPARDSFSVMLPPKLALMMVNFLQLPKEAVVLDPFCGSGTILQESLLVGYTNCIGTDISDKAIKDTHANLEWLKEDVNVETKTVQVKKCDVKNLDECVEKNIQGIVTEPFLGPPLRGKESTDFIRNIYNDLDKLYAVSVQQFSKVCTKEARLVIVVPLLNEQKFEWPEFFSEIESAGFKRTDTGSLVYAREGQHIKRIIMVFQKNA